MSKKQDSTAMSSAEAEYVALSACCAQVMWMRTQLKDYGFSYNKIRLYCDSQSAIEISCNPVQHSRTKHIHTRYHFIKEQVKNGIIELYFVRTEYQLADMCTKALLEDRFQYLVRRIGRPSHLTVTAEYFFNNDLEFLKSSDPEKTYTKSIMKTKAARYEIVRIEDTTPTLRSTIKHGYDKDAKKGIKHWGERCKLWYRSQVNKFSNHNVYSTLKILGVKSISVKKLHGYGHLEEIVVKRADRQTVGNKKQYIADVKIMNYPLQVIPNDIYNLVDACKNAKEMWEQIKRLMFGSDVTSYVRHSRLMDKFDKFAAKEGESLESVYEILTTLVNIMKRNNVHPISVSINTKFLNCFQPKWRKYVTMVYYNQTGETVSDDMLCDSVVQFEPHVLASKAKKGYDENGNKNAGRQRRNQVFNAGNGNDDSNQIIQRVPRTGSTSGKENVQCYNYNEKGHYAHDCQKPRVRDAQYFREQMLLAMKDKVEINLNKEENDFMLDTSYGQSIQTIHMFRKTPNKVYDHFLKVGLGYKNPKCLKKAIAAQPKMYDGKKLHSTKLVIDSPDSEKTLEDTEESRLKMRNKMKIACDVSWKSKLSTLNDENVLLKTQVDYVVKERENVKLEYQKLFNSIKATRIQHKKELNELIEHVNQKTYAYADVHAQNQELLITIFELKNKLKTVDKGKNVNTKFDKSKDSRTLLCVTPLPKNIAIKAKKVSNSKVNADRSKLVTSHPTPTNEQGQTQNENILARGMFRITKTETQTPDSKTNINVSNSTGVESSNSVRRQKSKDTKSKNRVLKNTNAKSSTCVACYALSRNSNVKRTLFTTPVAAKSKNLGATFVVVKSRLSVANTLKETNKVIQLILWIIDSGCSKYMTGNLQQLRNFVEKFMGTVRFEDDHFATITGYGRLCSRKSSDLLRILC
nr:retrovirus-related Pol polyprotein from transposon TNT 1-94 [Tanacetum cinerariifolium]